MKGNFIELILGAVTLIISCFFVFFIWSSLETRGLSKVNSYSLTGVFGHIGSLKEGSSVEIGGIKVGSVQNIDIDPKTYLVQVTFTLSRDLKLPKDTGLAIESEGLLGGNYLKITPGKSKELLKANAKIRKTQDFINIESIVSSFLSTKNS